MKPYEPWNHMSSRQSIDSTSLFREVLRVKQELIEKDDPEMRQRLKSLTTVQEEYQRLNKALRLGYVSEKMIALLNDWELAGESRIVLGFEAQHAYAVMAGARAKKSPSTIFNWHEHREMEHLLRQAIDSGELQPNVSDQVVFSRTGKMGLMHVLNPLSFIKFKKWMATQPQRSTRQIEQDKQQVDFVEQLIADGLLSATYDIYY